MNPIKAIIAGIGAALGLAIVIAVVVLLWQIKGGLTERQNAKDVADSVRFEGMISELRGSLALRDAAAAQTRTVFVQARANSTRAPVVTGGGKKADSIANAAVAACFESATNALTACERARLTADSLGPVKDSLAAVERRLVSRQSPRWTASGSVEYEWPDRAPLLGIVTDLRIMKSLSLTAGGDLLLAKKDTTRARENWRVHAGVRIPFR